MTTVTHNFETLALFAVVGLSMATSLTLLVRVVARELGSGEHS